MKANTPTVFVKREDSTAAAHMAALTDIDEGNLLTALSNVANLPRHDCLLHCFHAGLALPSMISEQDVDEEKSRCQRPY